MWQFLNAGPASGAFNMMLDEHLAGALQRGTGVPTVRVYGWRPPCISLGRHQRESEIDADRAAADGIDIVRRPTGGRAILHWNEVTYSVVMVTGKKEILQVYNDISRALVEGLRLLGADALLERTQPDFPALYKSPSSAVCFSSAARYEVKIGGRKLIGSAQRRYTMDDRHEVVLQHGSLLLGPEHKRLTAYLRLDDPAQREAMKAEMDDKTIDLSAALGRNLTFDETAAALREGFERDWQIRFAEAAPDVTAAP